MVTQKLQPIYLKLLIRFIAKKVKIPLKKISGRNFFGRICVFHRGGGHKRLYNRIDLIRRVNCFGRIIRVFRDNYRTAYLAQILYDNGLMAFHIHAEGARAGSEIFSGRLLPEKIRSNI